MSVRMPSAKTQIQTRYFTNAGQHISAKLTHLTDMFYASP